MSDRLALFFSLTTLSAGLDLGSIDRAGLGLGLNFSEAPPEAGLGLFGRSCPGLGLNFSVARPEAGWGWYENSPVAGRASQLQPEA